MQFDRLKVHMRRGVTPWFARVENINIKAPEMQESHFWMSGAFLLIYCYLRPAGDTYTDNRTQTPTHTHE